MDEIRPVGHRRFMAVKKFSASVIITPDVMLELKNVLIWHHYIIPEYCWINACKEVMA